MGSLILVLVKSTNLSRFCLTLSGGSVQLGFGVKIRSLDDLETIPGYAMSNSPQSLGGFHEPASTHDLLPPTLMRKSGTARVYIPAEQERRSILQAKTSEHISHSTLAFIAPHID